MTTEHTFKSLSSAVVEHQTVVKSTVEPLQGPTWGQSLLAVVERWPLWGVRGFNMMPLN